MRFWKSLPGAVLAVAILVALLGCGAVVARVYQVSHPAKVTESPADLAMMLAGVEEVRFPAADGVMLAGWLVPGRPDGRAIVLCHDLGGSKASVINLATPLHRDGFTVLALDFRAHGASEGDGSSLGAAEKRDVIGAVDYLATRARIDKQDVGLYGVGMGAFAAVLAARDRPALRVLVLDGLYPDVEYALSRRVFESWRFGTRHLGFLPRALFGLFGLSRRGIAMTERAADALPALDGRDLLLLSAAGDVRLSAEIERMYRSLPDRRDSESNLLRLPATAAEGLYGKDLERYVARVCEFFRTRLG